MAFVDGWSPEHGRRAEARLATTGRYCVVAPSTKAKPTRPAVSLSHLRLDHYLQGDAGCCWVHSPKQLFEVTARAKGYTPFSASRRAIGHAAMALFRGGGNPSDGGSPTDAINVMTVKGVGIAHEDLCPYTDDYRTLGRAPSREVYEDAARTHLIAPVKVKDVAEVVSMIDAGMPVANGYPCPSTMQEKTTFVDSIGRVMGGHSQLIWGYLLPGVKDEYLWLELENWWGLIYPPLPPSIARHVDGYEPVRADRTSSAWIRADVYLELCVRDGYAEHVSATGVDGLSAGLVLAGPGFLEAFSI